MFSSGTGEGNLSGGKLQTGLGFILLNFFLLKKNPSD